MDTHEQGAAGQAPLTGPGGRASPSTGVWPFLVSLLHGALKQLPGRWLVFTRAWPGVHPPGAASAHVSQPWAAAPVLAAQWTQCGSGQGRGILRAGLEGTSAEEGTLRAASIGVTAAGTGDLGW